MTFKIVYSWIDGCMEFVVTGVSCPDEAVLKLCRLWRDTVPPEIPAGAIVTILLLEG